MQRNAMAQWQGDGLTGNGTLTSQSGALQKQPYSFKTRFESEDGKAGTNPEELMAAAHAGCYSMALSFMLNAEGYKPDTITTQAFIDIQKKDQGFSIAAITLDLKAIIPGINNEQFKAIAQKAKENCPVSKALSSVPISLHAVLLEKAE